MINRKMATAAAVLFVATLVASSWSLVHLYETDPERVTIKWVIFGHLLGPAVDVAMWILIRRSARRFPDPQNLEAPLKRHFGFILVSVFAVIALKQTMLLARQLDIHVSLHNIASLPVVLMGVFLVVIGNGLGKLPSPYKGRRPEPFSWDKMNRLTGWIFVILGLGLVAGSLALPRSAILPGIVVAWVLCMSLLLVKRHRLRQNTKG